MAEIQLGAVWSKFYQVPKIAVEVLEYSHEAIISFFRFSLKLDAAINEETIVPPEVVGPQE